MRWEAIRGGRALVDDSFAAATWNADRDDGRRVASGLHFVKMTAPGFTGTKTIVVTR